VTVQIFTVTAGIYGKTSGISAKIAETCTETYTTEQVREKSLLTGRIFKKIALILPTTVAIFTRIGAT
jgi:hypothetical protein